MNILLIFFAIPLAVIILSAILETFIHCPFKVAGIFFAIFIVVAFALGGTAILIVTAILYTLLSFITAAIIRIIINRMCNRCEYERRCRFCRDECSSCNFNNYDRINNETNVALRTLNDLNTINNLNDINSLNNFNNRSNNEDINQLTRDTSNVFNQNNICRRYR